MALSQQWRWDVYGCVERQECRTRTGTTELGVICSDFDDDGFVDIYVANDSRRPRFYITATERDVQRDRIHFGNGGQ